MSTITLQPLDISKPAKELLIDKFNALNSLQLAYTDFVLGTPSAVTGSDSGLTTTVDLLPTVTSQFYNKITLTYTRVSLPQAFSVGMELASEGRTQLYDLLDSINGLYGIYLTQDDVEDATVVYVDDDVTKAGNVTVTAKADSVLFVGSATVPLNSVLSQGIGTYNNEQTYLALVRTAGLDTVVALDTQGKTLSNFRFFGGATVTSSVVKAFFVTNAQELILVGTFIYSVTPVGGGAAVVYNRRMVKMDKLGNILTSSSAALFGADYSLTYFPDPERNRVLVIDRAAQIGGNVYGVHSYAEDGTYQSSFSVQGLTVVPQSLAIAPSGDLYFTLAGTDINAGKVTVTKRLASGALDPAATDIVVERAGDVLATEVLSVDTGGVYLRLKGCSNFNTSVPLVAGGQSLWTAPTTTHYARFAPVVKFTLVLAVDPDFNPVGSWAGVGVTGVPVTSDNVFTSSASLLTYSTYFAYAATRVNAVTGDTTETMVAFDQNGAVQLVDTTFQRTDASWSVIEGLTADNAGSIIAYGLVQNYTADGVQPVVGAIVAYSYRAQSGGVIASFEGANVLKMFCLSDV